MHILKTSAFCLRLTLFTLPINFSRSVEIMRFEQTVSDPG